MPPDAARLVVEYTAGLEDGCLPNVHIVAPDAQKRALGDPAPSSAYAAIFADLIASRDETVLCLVGPYGYSPAFSSANTARNELQRRKLNPERVVLHNTGRAFLGLGAVAAAIASSGVSYDAAVRRLDEGASRASMWLVAETTRLGAAGNDLRLEAPGGLPDERFTLLRVRLSSRVVGGFAAPLAALSHARDLAGVSGRALALVAPGLDCDQAEIEQLIGAERVLPAPMPVFFHDRLGDCVAFGVAPLLEDA